MTVDQVMSDCQIGAARLLMAAEKPSVDIHASGVYAIYRDEIGTFSFMGDQHNTDFSPTVS
jgi:hypothetical protein